MILTATKILEKITDGSLKIEPFSLENLNPNSYNLTIADELVTYNDAILDTKAQLNTLKTKIPNEGYVLHPGRLYLAKTLERTETNGVVPVLYGRSSAARLGMSVTLGAGLGDTGYAGVWTLAITVTQPVKIYKNMKLAQVVFYEVSGDVVPYDGKYQNSTDISPSQYNKEVK